MEQYRFETELLDEIRSFMQKHKIHEPYRFGRIACNDKNVIARLEDGRGLNTKLINKIRNFMYNYKGQ